MNLYGVAYQALGSLAEPIIVLRRAAAVNAHGRTETERLHTYTYHAHGIVVPLLPGDLVREPGYELQRSTIEINTVFALRGPSPGVLADQIVWHGDTYVVINIRGYSKFGVGFTDAICQLVDVTDPLELRNQELTV